jgi:hypothetical protein
MRVLLPIAILGYQVKNFSNFISLRVSTLSLGYSASVNVIFSTLFYCAIGWLVANLSIERYMTLLCIQRDNWKYWAIRVYRTVLLITGVGILGFTIATVINTASSDARAGDVLLSGIATFLVVLCELILTIAMGKVKKKSEKRERERERW